MDDTLNEAHEYYSEYIIYKDEEPKLANLFIELAKDHLDIYLKLHNNVVSLINDYKQKNGDAPNTMKEMWKYQHTKLTNEYEELKYKLYNL